MKKYFGKILLILSIFIMSLPAYALKLRPIGFDKSLDTGGFQEYTLTNTSKEIVRYKIEVKNTGKPTDISNYVTVYPKVLTVEPLTEATFKVYVEETEMLKGEYSFILGVKPIKMPKLDETKKGKVDSAISMRTALEVEVFAYAGDMEEKFEVLSSNFYKKDGEKYFEGKIKNNTGRGFELATAFVDRRETILDLEPEGRLFDGSSTKIQVKVPKNTKYIMFYDYNNNKLLEQKIKVK